MEWTIEKKTSLIEWQCIEADSIEDLKEKLKTELPNMQWEHDKLDFCIDNFRAYNENIEQKKQQLDKLEERIILGKTNEQLAERLSEQLNSELREMENKLIKWKDEEHKKQLAYRSLTSNQKGTEMPDGTMYYETIYNEEDLNREMSLDEQIELVRQVIKKVILDRPSRNLLNIEIHNNIDDKVYKMTYDTFRYKKV